MNDPMPKPWTCSTAEARRSIAEGTAWNAALPVYDPGVIPDAKPPKPKPGTTAKGGGRG